MCMFYMPSSRTAWFNILDTVIKNRSNETTDRKYRLDFICTVAAVGAEWRHLKNFSKSETRLEMKVEKKMQYFYFRKIPTLIYFIFNNQRPIRGVASDNF